MHLCLIVVGSNYQREQLTTKYASIGASSQCIMLAHAILVWWLSMQGTDSVHLIWLKFEFVREGPSSKHVKYKHFTSELWQL